jgi:hypothetical protein
MGLSVSLYKLYIYICMYVRAIKSHHMMFAHYHENLSLYCNDISYVGWWQVEGDPCWYLGQKVKGQFTLDIGLYISNSVPFV